MMPSIFDSDEDFKEWFKLKEGKVDAKKGAASLNDTLSGHDENNINDHNESQDVKDLD